MSDLTNGSIYEIDNTKLSTDFIGFKYNNIHSSEFGIVRTSDGSRYQDGLLPSSSDQVTPIPGGDGSYYFNTNFTERRLPPLSYAFDSLSEAKFRKLRQWLTSKGIYPLILDETPYKTYMAKVLDTSPIAYVCFGETGQPRVYKGEGSIQFTAYFPFAICKEKYLDQYTNLNIEEWKETSGLLPTQGIYDNKNNTIINLYNPGDIETPFKAFYEFTTSTLALSSIYISEGGNTLSLLNFKSSFEKKGNDKYLMINSETELLEGYDENKKPTGNLYNEYIGTGEIFRIPIITDTSRTIQFISNGAPCESLEYDYLYY